MREHYAENKSTLLFEVLSDPGKIGFLIEPIEEMLEDTACFKNHSKRLLKVKCSNISCYPVHWYVTCLLFCPLDHFRNDIKSCNVYLILSQRNSNSSCPTSDFQHRSIEFFGNIQKEETIWLEVLIFEIVEFGICILAEVVICFH